MAIPLFRCLCAILIAWAVAQSPAYAESDPGYDLVVVGAGPGGLVSALSALHEGKKAGKTPRILVVEKRGPLKPSAKLTQPDTLGGSAFSRLQILGVRPEVVSMLGEFGVDVGKGRRGDVHLLPKTGRLGDAGSESVGDTYPMQINELQKLLVESARAQGIEVRFSSELTELSRVKNGAVELSVEQNGAAKTIKSRWVIGGDGASSAVRTLAKMPLIERQRVGRMVGVWFDGVRAGRQVVQRAEHPQGRAGALLGDGKTLYGLFALPPHLAKQVPERGPIPPAVEAKVKRFALSVAKDMLPAEQAAKLRASRTQTFDIKSNRAKQVVSSTRRTLLIGDAVRTVNPHTGSGANYAMLDGALAGKSIAQLTERPAEVTRILRRFAKDVRSRTRQAHADSAQLAYTFRAPRVTARGLRQARGQRQAQQARRGTGQLRAAKLRKLHRAKARSAARTGRTGKAGR